jgi:tetratricopeptide (TPR) repeat protein
MRTVPPTLRRCLLVILPIAATLPLALPATAQEPTHIEGLGSLAFPNSGAEAAQHDFLRGVLLLHSFEYDYAAEAFRAAQEADPDFALAYWGEAMTYTHPVWDEKDPEAARAALNRLAPSPEARQAKAPTAREKGYLQAVEVLYGDGPKERLDTLYSAEMAALAEAYPEDLEAQAFHALSLLGLSQGNRDVPTYMRAGAIALDVFEKNPGHPGAAHYTIHSFDDPTHAPLALKAAWAYGPIAPDAGHAQHMTTHIFLAMGMWDDVVAANIRADAVTDRNQAARGLPQPDCVHYNQWLMYGYQQQGRYEDAEALLMGCYAQAHDERLPAGMRQGAAFSYALQRAVHLADTRDGDGEPAHSTLEFPEDAIVPRMLQAWGDGVAAVHRGDMEVAHTSLAYLSQHEQTVPDHWVSPYAPVWRGTLEAYARMHMGDGEGALAAAHAAAEYEAALPVDFGPPIAAKPARELEGEILLELGRAEEAMTAFSLALGRTPNRIHALMGYAHAAEAAGHTDVAEETMAQLHTLLAKGDRGAMQGHSMQGRSSERP